MTSRLDALAAAAAAAFERIAAAAEPGGGVPESSESAVAEVDAALATLADTLAPYLREWELARLGDRAPHAVARHALLATAARAEAAHGRLLAAILEERERLRARIAELDRLAQGASRYAAAEDDGPAPR